MASSYRINRYNWLAQKLLVRRQHEEIIQLQELLSSKGNQDTDQSASSEYLIYAYGLALMRRGTRLDEVIYALQQLSFDKNPRYFMLLSQCLMFAGQYDAVVALSRRLLGDKLKLADSFEAYSGCNSKLTPGGQLLVGDARFWLNFGRCLEFQSQMKEALAAFKVAANLAAGHPVAELPSNAQQASSNSKQTHEARCSFQEPNVKLAEFYIRHQADYKAAIQTLAAARRLLPQNHTIDPILALALGAQPTSSKSNMATALEMLRSLESMSSYHRNPAFSYNQLALRCRLRQTGPVPCLRLASAGWPTAGQHANLGHLLITGFLLINSLHQSVDLLVAGAPSEQSKLIEQIDRLSGLLRSSDTSCWRSPALWNNLGLCYLARRKFIGALGCLIKAQLLDPIDWRVNLNLAITFLHVGLSSRALACLLTAKSSYLQASGQQRSIKLEPLIATLMAVSYENIEQPDEARRLHLDGMIHLKSMPTKMPVISLINYLIFLHRRSQQKQDPQTESLKLQILDQLEYCWLQRSHHDVQFSGFILDIARQIGEQSGSKTQRKAYAWTKASARQDQEGER